MLIFPGWIPEDPFSFLVSPWLFLLNPDLDLNEKIIQLTLYKEISEHLFCNECFLPIMALTHLSVFLEDEPNSTLRNAFCSEGGLSPDDPFLHSGSYGDHLRRISLELKETHEHCCCTGE